jgi:hypothetical protein
VRHPFSRYDYFYTENSERATREVSISLSQTLMIKGLTVEYRHVKGAYCPARPQYGNGLAAIGFIRFPAS